MKILSTLERLVAEADELSKGKSSVEIDERMARGQACFFCDSPFRTQGVASATINADKLRNEQEGMQKTLLDEPAKICQGLNETSKC